MSDEVAVPSDEASLTLFFLVVARTAAAGESPLARPRGVRRLVALHPLAREHALARERAATGAIGKELRERPVTLSVRAEPPHHAVELRPEIVERPKPARRRLKAVTVHVADREPGFSRKLRRERSATVN